MALCAEHPAKGKHPATPVQLPSTAETLATGIITGLRPKITRESADRPGRSGEVKKDIQPFRTAE